MPVPAWAAARTVPKNSLMLSTSGCSRRIADSMVEPQRPVPTTNVSRTRSRLPVRHNWLR